MRSGGKGFDARGIRPAERPSFSGIVIMSKDNKSNGGRNERAILPRARMSEKDPFESWLQKQLHTMYDEIVSEPLPESLVKLIDNDAAAGGDKEDKPL